MSEELFRLRILEEKVFSFERLENNSCYKTILNTSGDHFIFDAHTYHMVNFSICLRCNFFQLLSIPYRERMVCLVSLESRDKKDEW